MSAEALSRIAATLSACAAELAAMVADEGRTEYRKEHEEENVNGQFGPGVDWNTPTKQERAAAQKRARAEHSRARLEDANRSTRPGETTLADLKKGQGK